MKLVLIAFSIYSSVVLSLVVTTLLLMKQQNHPQLSLRTTLSVAYHSADYTYRFPEIIDGRRSYFPTAPDIDFVALSKTNLENR